MNVSFVCLGIYGREGGIERFNRRVLDALSSYVEAGTVSSVVATALWDGPGDVAEAPPSVTLRPGRSRKLGTAKTFATTVRQQRPDVVLYGHVLLLPLAPLARMLRPRARHLLIVHGHEVWNGPGRLRRWLVRRKLDGVIAVSHYTADRMRSAYELGDAVPFHVLPNAAEVPVPEEGVTAPELEGDLRLLTVSRLALASTDKHIDKAIMAMPEVVARHPGCHYYIVGEGDWRPALERLATEQGVGDHVHFVGSADDALRNSLYRSCDVFVLPSTQEGFGIVFLEAWGHRLPVIAADRGAAPEVVRHEREGLLVPPEPHAIAAAIDRLLSDRDLRSELGEAGRNRLEEEFTDQHFRTRLASILAGGNRGS